MSDTRSSQRSLLMIGEQRAVRSFLRCEPLVRGPLEVELRESAPTTDPRSGQRIGVPPLVVLWVWERPHAVRVRSVIAVNRFPPNPRLVEVLEEEAGLAGLPVERVHEAGLWRLFHRPPRPRLAR
ncbi:MAG TPA: hypothetical protein VGF21_01875 [Thermoleophilaceae bacterium]